MYNMISENKKMFEFVINVVLFLNIYFFFNIDILWQSTVSTYLAIGCLCQLKQLSWCDTRGKCYTNPKWKFYDQLEQWVFIMSLFS